MKDIQNIGILKSIWTRRPDGRWGIHAAKGVYLKPKAGFEREFFRFENDMELLTNTPPSNLGDLAATVGPTDVLLKQCIVPIVSWVEGAASIRCIGTGFIVSCSGYVVTASHVILDPQESGYGKRVAREGRTEIVEGANLGILIPANPMFEGRGFRLIGFQEAWYWGAWKEGPLLHEGEKLHSLTDVAICKLPEKSDGSAYQPLHLSIYPFSKEEEAYAIGYAEMQDIPVKYADGKPQIGNFDWELYVSTGKVREVFPLNHLEKLVPTPGPCFDFEARIPGKMSGAPIFGAQGAIIRGVVSRSFSGEKHAYGCMIGPVMTLPFTDGRSLKAIMDGGQDGMAVVSGQGL